MPSPTPPPALLAALERSREFRQLSPSQQRDLAGSFALHSVDAGASIADAAGLDAQLFLVVSGFVELVDSEHGQRVGLGPGEVFGSGAAPAGDAAGWSARAAGAVEIATLAAAELTELCLSHPVLRCFLAPSRAGTGAASGSDPYLGLMTTPIRSLLRREPITVAPTATVRQAAELMRDQRVSSVLIVESGHLFGLVTDRDLRNRALAAGLDARTPILDVATVAPLCIDIRSPAFDALLLMARHSIHHVPVMDGARVAGMITATDLTEQHSTSAVYLAGDLYEQDSIEGLARAIERVKRLQQNLAAAGASAYSTGHIITAVTDALTSRLLQLAEARLGPPPVDYAWVAAGSQARSEQTAKSDQDNCLVLDDAYDAQRHGTYFKALADFVCDGLDACGYVYCPGEMMAKTDAWRQPLHRWTEYFRGWTDEPEPKALMLTCVFFDLRCIYGKVELLDQLRRDVLRRTRDNGIFLAYMVGNALTHQPPLSLFRGIAPIRSGEHRGTVDLKHSGIVPIVDLARVYALAGGHDAVNTHDRLASAAHGQEISEQGARDLREALEFLAGLRIRHQAHQLAEGRPADNFLNLDELSNFERSHLKEAFAVVQTLQNVLGQRYQSGRF